MATLDQVRLLVAAFVARVVGLQGRVESQETTVAGVRRTNALPLGKQDSAGVYVFARGEEVQYIGQALATVGLARRVFEQLGARTDPRWAAVVDDPLTRILLVTVPDDEEYWVASLELLLIRRLPTPFNMRP